MSKERLERRASGSAQPNRPRNALHRKDAEEEGTSIAPEDIARQFLADAIHQDDYEAPEDEKRRAVRRDDTQGEEHTSTRRRLDLRGNAVREGSLFDDEGEELGETREPELDTDDSPHQVTRPRPPQR
jgi:hypothetical protein